MPAEVLWMLDNYAKRFFTPLRTNTSLLRYLTTLGADRTKEVLKVNVGARCVTFVARTYQELAL